MEAFAHDFSEGLRASRRLISLRWKSIRKTETKVIILSALAFYIFGMTVTANLGYVVQTAAQDPDTAAGIFARTWIQYLAYGVMGLLGTAAIGSAAFVAFFGPFTGSATLSLASSEDLQSLRPPMSHRYFDSLFLNMFSGLGLLQLLTLTGVASLLTLDGQRAPGMFFTWAVWFLLMTIMTLVGWSLEWVARRRGKRVRWIVGAVGLIVLGAVIAVDKDHGTTLFGFARYYTIAARLGIAGWNSQSLLLIIGTLSVAFLILVTGLQVQRQALRLPIPGAVFAKARTYRSLGNSSLTMAISLYLRLIWRTPEVRRPMLSVLIIGLPAMFFFDVDGNIELSATLAIPLVISLSWAINNFALFGPGLSWLSSNPKILARLPIAAMIVQFSLAVGAIASLSGLAFMVGNATPATAGRVILYGATSMLLATAVSINLSLARPIRAPLTGRGDAIVPPVTALGYMMLMMIFTGAPVFTLMTLPEDWQIRLAFISFVALAAVGAVVYAMYYWSQPHKRARVVQAVSAE